MFQGGVFVEITSVCNYGRLLMDDFGQTICSRSRKSREHYFVEPAGDPGQTE